MAIELKNSMFVHIPKTGGRTIKTAIQQYVKHYSIVGDPVYDAHGTPPTDKQVFAFVRHPATFIRSLWHHRAKKKSNRYGHAFNWQEDIRMEKECQSNEYNKFVENILNGKNYVLDYYKYYTNMYEDVQFGKMEHLLSDFINLLKTNNEEFDELSLRRDRIKVGVNINLPPTDFSGTMSREQLKHLVTVSEKELCERYGYEI